MATVDDPNAADGGPRRVKTLVVRPDGSVMPPAAPPAAEAAPPAMAQVAAADAAHRLRPAAGKRRARHATAAYAASATRAGTGAGAGASPGCRPGGRRSAARGRDPGGEAASRNPWPPLMPPRKPPASSKYVVQVGSKQNQTEALATFADMQQKYPTLLANYRPMVQKADLGAEGRLVSPAHRTDQRQGSRHQALHQLKSQGMPDCLVMAAQ